MAVMPFPGGTASCTETPQNIFLAMGDDQTGL